MSSDYLKEPLNQTKMGVSILVACIVQTLNESDPTFQKRFLDRVAAAYSEVQDLTGTDCSELLYWPREMLKREQFRPDGL